MMRKVAALMAFLAAPLPLCAQENEAEAPRDVSAEIVETAFRAIDFVPIGWKLFERVQGDLNGDGKTDTALIIQRNDPAGVISNPDGLGMDQYERNPRILIVALADDAKGYRRISVNRKIIPDHDSPVISDPFADLSIEDGKLLLRIEFFASAGSWTMSNHTYNSRWDGQGMRLIGYDSNTVQRNSGEMTEISVNFLTAKKKLLEGNIDGSKEDIRWSNLADRQPVYLDMLDNAYETEF